MQSGLPLRSTKKYKLSHSVKNVLCSSSYFRLAVLFFPGILRGNMTEIVYNANDVAPKTLLSRVWRHSNRLIWSVRHLAVGGMSFSGCASQRPTHGMWKLLKSRMKLVKEPHEAREPRVGQARSIDHGILRVLNLVNWPGFQEPPHPRRP